MNYTHTPRVRAHRERETERERERETERQTDRQTDRDRDREKQATVPSAGYRTVSEDRSGKRVD